MLPVCTTLPNLNLQSRPFNNDTENFRHVMNTCDSHYCGSISLFSSAVPVEFTAKLTAK